MGTLVVFGSLGLARFGYSMVLPDMQDGLGIDNTQTGALATANLIGYLTLALVGGVLASRYGPRVVIAAGLAVAGAGMLLTGLSRGFADAAAWRVLTGIGSGASNVPAMALLASWFAMRRRGLASGIAVAGSALGLIFAGAVVPRVLSAYGDDGWRTCWFIFGGITLLLAVSSLVFLRNRPAEVGLKPVGAGGEDAGPDRKTEGLQWGRVYRSRTVWHLGLVYVAFGFSYIIYMTFFTKHLIDEGGYTKAAAGDLFMTMGWVSLACGLLWGTVSDVIGRRRALVIVFLIHAAAFSLFALWTTPAGFTLSAVLFGLSAWSIPAIMAAACGDVLGPRLAPAALGLITLLFGIGQAVAPSIAGAMADASGSFFSALLLASGVALLGAVVAFLLRPAPAASDVVGQEASEG
ncbi:MAG: MFS transporter [Dehalococcoidia bacterium]|nr:MFS transporter [Dehalococcoidia bacterium]